LSIEKKVKKKQFTLGIYLSHFSDFGLTDNPAVFEQGWLLFLLNNIY